MQIAFFIFKIVWLDEPNKHTNITHIQKRKWRYQTANLKNNVFKRKWVEIKMERE
jgi:hypothetical protein